MGCPHTGIDLLHIIGEQDDNRMDLGYFILLDGGRLFVQCQAM